MEPIIIPKRVVAPKLPGKLKLFPKRKKLIQRFVLEDAAAVGNALPPRASAQLSEALVDSLEALLVRLECDLDFLRVPSLRQALVLDDAREDLNGDLLVHVPGGFQDLKPGFDKAGF